MKIVVSVLSNFELTAMPGICDVTDFGLTDPKKNKEMAQKLLGKKKEVLWETDTHIFFRTGDWASGGYMALYKKSKGFLVYLVKFEVKNGVMNYRKVVVQVKVWRASGDPACQGLAKKVFFDILLSKYGAIMSDTLQTNDGKRFWIDNMAQAKILGHQVAYVDKNHRTIEVYNPQVDMEDWIDSFHTWGTEMKSEGERFLIFKD